MLQLRQCKLMFPSVHLLVGVCSSALVEQHKSHPVFSSEERYESMRHIRWVDEVVEDAPWQVDQAFIDKWQIDYVAHDEEPYASAGKEDVYAYAKSIGQSLRFAGAALPSFRVTISLRARVFARAGMLA